MKEALFAIISKIAIDVAKEGVRITSEQIRLRLKDWILKDEEYDVVSEVINTIPDSYKLSEKMIEAYIETNTSLTRIIAEAVSKDFNKEIKQEHMGSGDNVAGDKYVTYKD